MHGVQTAHSAVASLRACPTPWLIGVLHLPALPGAPRARVPVDAVARAAAEDARILQDRGFTAVMIENFHDIPFAASSVADETIAAMAVVASAVRREVDLPVGPADLDVLGEVAIVGTSLPYPDTGRVDPDRAAAHAERRSS